MAGSLQIDIYQQNKLKTLIFKNSFFDIFPHYLYQSFQFHFSISKSMSVLLCSSTLVGNAYVSQTLHIIFLTLAFAWGKICMCKIWVINNGEKIFRYWNITWDLNIFLRKQGMCILQMVMYKSRPLNFLFLKRILEQRPKLRKVCFVLK